MPSSRYWRFKIINRKEKTRKFKMIFFWFFFTAAFLTILWSFSFSPFFKITEIKLPENNLVAINDVRQLIDNIMPLKLGENLLILPINRLKSELAAAFPAITDITIKKELFHALKIDFIKRVQIGIWCNNANCYYFDKEGIIFKDAPQTEGALILKIKDFSPKEVLSGNRALNYEQLKFIIDFNNKIGEKNQLKIIEFKIKPEPNIDLEAITNGDWLIYLDSAQDPSVLVNNLMIVLNESIKNKIKDLKYVDLRIPKHVYYIYK